MINKPDTAQHKKINISLLQTFHNVAKTGSFSSASKELNISYQSVANHIRRLEQIYGTKLVIAEKGSRSVKLTPQGKALKASLGKELETILSRISLLMHDVGTIFRIGVPQALFHRFFALILEKYRIFAPDIELSFFERDTTLETMMQDGSLDVCISERLFGDAVITQHLICEYKLSIIYQKEWFSEPLDINNIQKLRQRPFLTYEPGQTIRTRALDYLDNIFGEHPKISTSTSGSSSIVSLVEAGLGWAIVPEWCITSKHPSIRKLILNDVMPIKIYFGNSSFLEPNEYVRTLYNTCKEIITSELELDENLKLPNDEMVKSD